MATIITSAPVEEAFRERALPIIPMRHVTKRIMYNRYMSAEIKDAHTYGFRFLGVYVTRYTRYRVIITSNPSNEYMSPLPDNEFITMVSGIVCKLTANTARGNRKTITEMIVGMFSLTLFIDVNKLKEKCRNKSE